MKNNIIREIEVVKENNESGWETARKIADGLNATQLLAYAVVKEHAENGEMK